MQNQPRHPEAPPQHDSRLQHLNALFKLSTSPKDPLPFPLQLFTAFTHTQKGLCLLIFLLVLINSQASHSLSERRELQSRLFFLYYDVLLHLGGKRTHGCFKSRKKLKLCMLWRLSDKHENILKALHYSFLSQAWWLTCIISTLWKTRQDKLELKTDAFILSLSPAWTAEDYLSKNESEKKRRKLLRSTKH